MQLVTQATWLAHVARCFVVLACASMLMDTAAAVEVIGDATPRLPPPGPVDEVAAAIPAAQDPPSPDCFILGSRSFSIPFTVEQTGAPPVQVHLFVSRGRGLPWTFLDQKHPNIPEKRFQYTAQEDGEYWFATRTVDAQGRSHPESAFQPQLKVFVDTTKPEVSLDVEADATGRVDAVLAVNDATPVKNMQLRYITDSQNRWQTVEIYPLPPGGKLQFNPAGAWKQLSLQLVATDTPGNQRVVTQLLRRPRLAEVPAHRYAANDPERFEAHPIPFRMPSPAESIDVKAIATPVIKLDRHRPRVPSNVSTAHGYAPSPSMIGFGPNVFRGSGLPSQPAPGRSAPPQLAPAPPSEILPHKPVQPSPTTTPTTTAARGATTAKPPTKATPPGHETTPRPVAGGGGSRIYPSPSQGDNEPPIPFAPPSTGNQLAGVPLPPPASPEQIGRGFDLNSPQQSAAGAAAAEKDRTWTRPSGARSPAEAMKPLSEKSAITDLPAADARHEAPAESVNQTPRSVPDASAQEPSAYQARRPLEEAIVNGRWPVRFSDSERFSLAYELEAVGSRGVEAIELYGSLDGRTWELWGSDPDRVSPFDIETKEQGVFGFRIVVIGQNGLASPRPLSGEAPDIVVVVDKQKPAVRITGAQYGEGDRIGCLVIRYECQDEHLMKRPIALSFSDNLDGPWTTIAAGLRNDGDYVWPADPQLPRQLFLRIDAKDEAGNVGTHVLDQPIDTQGLAPRARIRGFQPLSGPAPPISGEQTAKRPRGSFK